MGKPFEQKDLSEVMPSPDELVIEGLRQNNLKNLSLGIPHDRITVIAGLSGSGKSSLAFDSIFAEGRWRFMESLSTYTRLFIEKLDRPDMDAMRNIRPAIAIEQKNPVRTSRSTVATATELYDYLRLLFARIARPFCPGCGREISRGTPTGIADRLLADIEGEKALVGFSRRAGRGLAGELLGKGYIRIRQDGVTIDVSEDALPQEGVVRVVTDRLIIRKDERPRLVDSLEIAMKEGNGEMWVEAQGPRVLSFSARLGCPECSIEIEEPTALTFSFNHPIGACSLCKGFGNILRYDEEKVVPDKTLPLGKGAVEPWTKPAYRGWQEDLRKNARRLHIPMDRPFCELEEGQKRLVFDGGDGFEGVKGFFEFLEARKYKLHIRVFLSRYKGQFPCDACLGARLKKGALDFRIVGMDIARISAMTIDQARGFFNGLSLSAYEREVSKEALRQVVSKLEYLCNVGLGYMTLDRRTRTLSGGEAQRVFLSNQMGAALSGALYVLDEPSIGLHPRDIDMLSGQIKKLSDRGNTVIMVEHDPSLIRGADHIVELGPGSGERGGHVVYSGGVREFIASSRTLTADYLSGRREIAAPRWRRKGSGLHLEISGARGNNLKDISLKIPLKTLTAITGVSGSGKSTLVMDTIYNALALRFGVGAERPLPYDRMEGAGHLSDVRLVDQSPIGKTPRSNPITYMGGFDEIRRLFAGLPKATALGMSAASFSFNVNGGRCPRCAGQGVVKLEMYFLPDVYMKCEACNGRRYKPQVLDVKYRGRNIYDVLNMTFEEASRFFPDTGELRRKFRLLEEVGLGYLGLGQSATTLSGGEAQRLKIARELAHVKTEDVLYILDEPTTGLHMEDVRRLLSVAGRLVDAGNTVLVVEHNLDCIKAADHVIDLGPEGGENGGFIVAQGAPEKIARTPGSHTGRYLREALSQTGGVKCFAS